MCFLSDLSNCFYNFFDFFVNKFCNFFVFSLNLFAFFNFRESRIFKKILNVIMSLIITKILLMQSLNNNIKLFNNFTFK